MSKIEIPKPELQINFSKVLKKIRETYLQEALSKTIAIIDLSKLDRDLFEYVPEQYLKSLAKQGLRGELVYPVPYLLEINPFLLGYYRLLRSKRREGFFKYP